jgi:hypothetical protein
VWDPTANQGRGGKVPTGETNSKLALEVLRRAFRQNWSTAGEQAAVAETADPETVLSEAAERAQLALEQIAEKRARRHEA